jgi:hypothetical protein
LAIAGIFLISIANGSLDSGNTGLSPIPMDLKISNSDSQETNDNQATTPEKIGMDVVTNRKNTLSKSSSLQ